MIPAEFVHTRQGPTLGLSCSPADHKQIIYAPASARHLMNWFKRLYLSEQYRLATLGTLRR